MLGDATKTFQNVKTSLFGDSNVSPSHPHFYFVSAMTQAIDPTHLIQRNEEKQLVGFLPEGKKQQYFNRITGLGETWEVF